MTKNSFLWYNKSSNVGAVAQLVEQRPEEPCVTGSSPVGATINKVIAFGSVAQLVRARAF